MHDRGIFVEVIHTMGKYYLYDVNTNSIHEISEKMYCFVKCNLDKKADDLLVIADDSLKDEIRFLLEQKCLSDNRPKTMEHTADIYIKSLTTQYLANVLLQVTKQCNFKCRYCAFAGDTNLERDHSNQYMDWDTAKKAIDFLYQNSKLSRRISISFYGGEPLLNFGLIKRVIEYADELYSGRNISYGMTTNLSVLTDEMIDIFNSHDFDIVVSLDGSEKLHNKNRRFLSNGKGTYRIVMNNLMRLSEKMTNFSSKVSINSVTDPEEDFNEYVNYFKSNKIFNDIKVHYDRIDTSRLKYDLLDNPQYIVESNKAKLRDYLKLMCDKKIDMSKADNTVGEIAGSYYYFMLKKKLNAKEHHRGPCVPGVRKLFVTTEGNLLPCEKVSEESYSMIIGNVKEGFFYDKIHKLLNIGKLTEKDCINCTCIRHCSICAKEIDNIIDLDADIKRNVCKAKKLFLKEQIEKHIIYKQVGLFDYIEG